MDGVPFSPDQKSKSCFAMDIFLQREDGCNQTGTRPPD